MGTTSSGNKPIRIRKQQAKAKKTEQYLPKLVLLNKKNRPGIKNRVIRPPIINPLLKRAEVIPEIIPKSLNAFDSHSKN